ncbi:MAG TPA: DUF1254 domain-containing protein [Candidatus Udaeobacter sp.]|nr:DUF1254 domain-containing protein [Candidatus Udaeobacter sp.]
MKPLTAIVALGLATNLCAQSNSLDDFTNRTLQRRAVEAVIWGMPAVNFERMLQGAIRNGAAPNQVVYWSRPVNWKDQTLTPNPDTIYFNPFYDTTAGPVVLEIPAAGEDGSITGSVDDAWQCALDDVGPAGVDKGAGGKYLITPPGYKEKAPDGYIVLPSSTFRGFAILRSNFKTGSDADIAAAVKYGKRIRMYPFGKPSDNTVFVDVYDKAYHATIPYDASYFEWLNRFVQAEPWLTRDKALIDTLKTIGIEKGKQFSPEVSTKPILDRAAREARAFLETKYESGFSPGFYDNSHWAVPVPRDVIEGQGSGYANPDSYPIDGRGVMYSIAYYSPKQLGTGQFYLMAIQDKSGQGLEGEKTYRLTVPANPPVKLYWSVTAYDRQTHALIRETSRPSRGSNSSDVEKNSDGSVDIYFGPKAPPGKESNWVPIGGRDFELMFRVYGPKPEFFEKAWKLPDIEEVNE